MLLLNCPTAVVPNCGCEKNTCSYDLTVVGMFRIDPFGNGSSAFYFLSLSIYFSNYLLIHFNSVYILITEKEGTTWIRKATDRRQWKTLMEGYILQWMDKAQTKTKTNVLIKHMASGSLLMRSPAPIRSRNAVVGVCVYRFVCWLLACLLNVPATG